MSAIIAAIIGLFTNGLGPFFTWLTSKDDAARDEALAQINAWIEALNTVTQYKAVQFGWWGTRMLFLGFSIGPLVHSFLIYMDSCGHFLFWFPHTPGSWHIVVPPEPFADLEKLIILSFFATTVTGGVLKTVQNGMQLRHEAELIKAGKADLIPQRRATLALRELHIARRMVPRMDRSGTSTPPIVWVMLGLVVIAAIVSVVFYVF